MKALMFTPGKENSAILKEIPAPPLEDGSLLVKMKAIGICGTDRELLSGKYGEAPKNSTEMIIGHESLGEIIEAPLGSGFVKGDLVVGVVRRPDPIPCSNCAIGEWDMCKNGLYTERGIKQRNGYCSEQYRLESEFAIKVPPRLGELGVLVEPASVVAKAWEHIEKIGHRAAFTPAKVLITGAGPVGLLAAMMGVQRKLEVHILDKVNEGLKPSLVQELGITYHSNIQALESLAEKFDIVLECTGSGELVIDVIRLGGPNSIVCLLGMSSRARSLAIDMNSLNKEIVLENEVIFGSVNANLRHYRLAEESLLRAPPDWLKKLITRKIPLSQWQEGLSQPKNINDIKMVIVPDDQIQDNPN